MAMLGDIVELSVVVRDLDEAAARFTRLFGLSVHRRDTSERFGFKNAILPTGIGHIELLQPTDPDRKSTRLNSSHSQISYAVFCLKKKKQHLSCTDLLSSLIIQSN